MIESSFFLIIAFIIALGIGYMGSKRKIGFGWAFALSLCNALLGLL